MSEQAHGFALGLEQLPNHELFLQQPPKLLYHYTNVGGAVGIVRSRSLWLTKIRYLNDTRELRHAIDLARGVAAGMRDNAGDPANIVAKFVHQLGSFEQTNICVSSFCEAGDLLSQWRGYGAAGQGISLGFRSDRVVTTATRQGLRLLRCIYDYTLQAEIMRGLLNHLVASFRASQNEQVISYFNTLFLQIAPALKDRAFSEEREWRIITGSISLLSENYQVREVNGRLVPYFVLAFPAQPDGRFDFVEEAWIGPSDRAQKTVMACGCFLRSTNCR